MSSCKNRMIPENVHKPDTSVNASGVEAKLKEAKLRDARMGKLPLRINSRTVILVKPENRNAEYAKKVQNKMNKASL